jgi:hypothetical protein
MTDIEPALSAEEWAKHRGEWKQLRGIVDHAAPQGVPVVLMGDEDGRPLVLSADRLPAFIAAANDLLPDSDPRKITRAMVRHLRDVIGHDEASYAEIQQAEAFLDVLACYLPPEGQ